MSVEDVWTAGHTPIGCASVHPSVGRASKKQSKEMQTKADQRQSNPQQIPLGNNQPQPPFGKTLQNERYGMSNVNRLDPAILRPSLTKNGGTDLKPSITTPAYGGGTPTEAVEIKAGLLDEEGNLKVSILRQDGTISPGLLKDSSSE